MPEKKPNRRVEYTKNALRNALIDLLSEKPLRNITVTDICARADINRSTFYLHYQDVYDLLHEIENGLLTHLRSMIPTVSSFPLSTGMLVPHLESLKKSPQLLALLNALLNEQGDPEFEKQVRALIIESFQTAWEQRMSGKDDHRKYIVFPFVISGTLATLAAWITGNTPQMTAKEVTELLDQIIEHGVSSLTKSP